MFAILAHIHNISFIPLFYIIAPTQPPQNVSAIVLNSTSVLISWYPPPPNQQNGPIRSYTLVYIATSLTDAGSIPLETEVHIDVSESYPLISFNQMRLDNLRPFTGYTVIIFAMNDAGSSSNASVHLRTDVAGCFFYYNVTSLSLLSKRNLSIYSQHSVTRTLSGNQNLFEIANIRVNERNL